MGRIAMLIWILLLLAVIALGYIRLAPSDPAVWHQVPEGIGNLDLAGGVERRVEVGPDGLARLDRIIRATPRTRVLAGTVPEGMVTYITRSLVFGFPDYTTVHQAGDALEIYARLRFGRSDLGVNRARVDQWLETLNQAG